MQEEINVLKDVYSKQNDIDSFFNQLYRYLDSIFSLEDEFSIATFDTIFTMVGNEDFSRSLYSCLISYDNNDILDSLSGLDDDKYIELTKDLICLYGPKLEKYYFKQLKKYSIRFSDVGYRNMHGEYELGIDLTNHANQSITIFDSPNKGLVLCSRIINVISEMGDNAKIDKNIKDRLKKQVKKL